MEQVNLWYLRCFWCVHCCDVVPQGTVFSRVLRDNFQCLATFSLSVDFDYVYVTWLSNDAVPWNMFLKSWSCNPAVLATSLILSTVNHSLSNRVCSQFTICITMYLAIMPVEFFLSTAVSFRLSYMLKMTQKLGRMSKVDGIKLNGYSK